MLLLSQLSFCGCDKTLIKSSLGEKRVWVTAAVAPRRELRQAGAEAETAGVLLRACCPWLSRMACSLWPAQPAFLDNPRGSSSHSGLDPPTSIVNQENVPQSSVMVAILQMRASPLLR